MTTDEREDDRRRRGLLVLLVASIFLMLLGLYGGYLALGGKAATGATGEPARQASRPSLVRPSGEPATRPTGGPVVVDGGGQAVAEPASDPDPGSDSGGGSAAAASGSPLATASKVVGDVAPGRSAILVLTVTNPGSRQIVVAAVSARVTSVESTTAAGPACSVAWYRVESFRGARSVPAGGSTTVELSVAFVSSPTVNQDSCKGATYSYSYRIEATA